MSATQRRKATLHVYLAHGASGTAISMKPYVEGLERHSVDATAVDLPKGNAERAVPVFVAKAGEDRAAAVIGGHSYGGRVASMAAAGDGFAGLVLLSYPLHRPGHPEELRVEHWPQIRCPVLLLSGEADPFARIELLRTNVRRIKSAQLVTYPQVGHGLLPVVDDAVARIAEFVQTLSR
jgi:predicted alpha/beta-hydrolase family hydrolase